MIDPTEDWISLEEEMRNELEEQQAEDDGLPEEDE